MKLWEMKLEPGVKIRSEVWTSGHYICLSESGAWIDDRGLRVADPPWVTSCYEYCVEPKKKKKITLYRHTTRKENGMYYQTAWSTGSSCSPMPVLTETKEIEIEETE